MTLHFNIQKHKTCLKGFYKNEIFANNNNSIYLCEYNFRKNVKKLISL